MAVSGGNRASCGFRPLDRRVGRPPVVKQPDTAHLPVLSHRLPRQHPSQVRWVVLQAVATQLSAHEIAVSPQLSLQFLVSPPWIDSRSRTDSARRVSLARLSFLPIFFFTLDLLRVNRVTTTVSRSELVLTEEIPSLAEPDRSGSISVHYLASANSDKINQSANLSFDV
jgi:hypothetical protein